MKSGYIVYFYDEHHDSTYLRPETVNVEKNFIQFPMPGKNVIIPYHQLIRIEYLLNTEVIQ